MEIRPIDNDKNHDLNRLAKGVFVNLFGKTFGRLAFIIGQVILARILGPDQFGIYGIGWNILRIASIISAVGIDSGVIHFAARDWEKDKKQYTSVVISALVTVLLFSGFLTIIIITLSNRISDFFSKPQLSDILFWFGISLPALVGAKVIASATRATKDMINANLIEEIFQPAANLLFIGFAFLIGVQLRGFVIATSASIFFGFLAGIIIILTGYIIRSVNWNEVFKQFRPLIEYSLPVAIPTLFSTLIILIDRMFIGYYLPEYETGVYQSVSLISVLFVALLSAFKSMAAPMVASYYHAGKMKDLRTTIQASTRWVAYIGFPLMMVLIVIPGTFLNLFFGPAYLMGAQVLVVLTCSQLINIGKGPIDQLLIMTGRQRIWLRITVLAFGLNIITNWLLVPRLGLMGAAISNIITFSTLTIGGLMTVKTEFGFLPFDRSWIRSIMTFCLLVAILTLINPIIALSDFWRLIVVSIISAGLFFGTLILYGLERDDLALIDNLKSFLLSKKASNRHG